MKGIGTCPVNFARDGCNMSQSKHCLTPCGIFTCRYTPDPAAHSTCTLLDIPSLNYIRLPNIPYYKWLNHSSRMFAMCVNNTVYVIYNLSYYMSRISGGGLAGPSSRTEHIKRICMFSIHLGKPTGWCRCAPISKALVKKAVDIVDTCTIGTRIYVLLRVNKPHCNKVKHEYHIDLSCYPKVEYEYHISCYDTISNRWSYPSQPPKTFKFRDPILVAVGPDILILCARKDYQCAKYSTVEDQWTAYPSTPSPAMYSQDNMIYLASAQWTAFPPTSSVDASLLGGLMHLGLNAGVHLVWGQGRFRKLDFYGVSSTSLTLLRSTWIPATLYFDYCMCSSSLETFGTFVDCQVINEHGNIVTERSTTLLGELCLEECTLNQ